MRKLTLLIDLLAALGMFSLILLVAFAVVSRAAFSASIPWAEEVGAYLMIWTGMLGTASHLQHDQFMALTLFQGRESRRVGLALTAIAAGATLAFLGLVFYAGFRMAFTLDTHTLSPAARLPMALIYSIFPLGAALIALGYLKTVAARARAAGRESQPC